MSTQVEEKSKRTRKPKARPAAIVMGCIEERLLSIDSANKTIGASESESIDTHIRRLNELFDELRRSLGKADSEEE